MKKVHFIGICGKGMSAVAKLLIDSGYIVTGSDEGFYPPVSTYIEKNNIPFIKGFKRENISNDVDTIVISKHAKLVPQECDEVKYAFELKEKGKVEIKSFPEILEDVTKKKESLVIAGSYGKSTCTALLAHILEYNNIDAGYFIGATPITPEQNAKVGTHKYFVLEGDEYPSANWDMTSKFMYYNAHDILITSLAHDHTNIFKTHNEFKQVFYDLINKLVSRSYLSDNEADFNLILCVDDESIRKEFIGINKNLREGDIQLTTYSLEKRVDIVSNYYAKNIIFGETTSFDLIYFTEGNAEEINLGRLETSLLGKHNIQNIIGVCAFALEKKIFKSILPIQQAVKSFVAVEGRLNQLATKSGIKVYEGFGSSVDKARSAIDAMSLHFSDKKLKIIFEPHTFSWRNKEALHWYDSVFKGAQKVYVYEPPQHGANTITQSTQEEIISRIKNSGVNVQAIIEEKVSIEKIIKETDLESDIILTLSSSNFDGLIEKLIKEI